MPSSFVPYEISPECIFYARGVHRDPEESQDVSEVVSRSRDRDPRALIRLFTERNPSCLNRMNEPD